MSLLFTIKNEGMRSKLWLLITSILINLVFTSWGKGTFAQTDKPVAAVAPVAFLGEVSEVQRQIIYNLFQEKLAEHYSLISQKQFDEAQDKAYASIDADQCTEEQCIRKIQELLQVENLFILQILQEAGDTQLSLTLVTLDSKIIKTEFCVQCKTPQLMEKITLLVRRITSGGTAQGVENMVIPATQRPSVTSPPVQISQDDYEACAQEYRKKIRKERGLFGEALLQTDEIKKYCNPDQKEANNPLQADLSNILPNIHPQAFQANTASEPKTGTPEFEQCMKDYREQYKKDHGLFASALLNVDQVRSFCEKN